MFGACRVLGPRGIRPPADEAFDWSFARCWREYQLLQFLLDHPHRFFTVSQLLGRAWADPALFPEEVRNYVRRIRKILADLEIPCELVNRPGRGYSLIFRPDE
jgi:DNA-binding response OmpR family regulator